MSPAHPTAPMPVISRMGERHALVSQARLQLQKPAASHALLPAGVAPWLWRSWQRCIQNLGGMIEAQQALLAFDTQDWDKASRLRDLTDLHLQNHDLPQALQCIQALQSFHHHFKEWRKLGLGRFIAEQYLAYVLAAKAAHPEASAQVYIWAKALTMGMENMHWNLLEKLIAVHEGYGDQMLAARYRLVLKRARA